MVRSVAELDDVAGVVPMIGEVSLTRPALPMKNEKIGGWRLRPHNADQAMNQQVWGSLEGCPGRQGGRPRELAVAVDHEILRCFEAATKKMLQEIVTQL